jgi:hypothetical protein
MYCIPSIVGKHKNKLLWCFFLTRVVILLKNLTNLAHILGQDLKEGSSRSHALFQVQKNLSLEGTASQDFYYTFFYELQ